MQNRQKQYKLDYNDIKITISSKFDSGNLENAIISQNTLILTPSLDPMHPQYSLKQSSKTFFHFSIKSSQSITLLIIIKNMKILQYFANNEQFDEYYRVCVGHKKKRGWQQIIQYQKVQLDEMKRVDVDSNYQLHFNLNVKQQQMYLAYHYPYSFQKSQDLLRIVKERVNQINQTNQKLYYFGQLLTESLERRPIHLLTMTANNKIIDEEQARITKSIFPFFQIEGRPKKFNKPYIFFTCRVHPGETSSSYVLEGILEFLLSNSKKSNLLLQNFVFLIVPVLNPDGVYHGTYRMDTLGHNLNRFYNNALSHKQPAIFAVHTLANYYSNRILFFMDLHSHPHPNKGSFIYGNCLPNVEQQLQSQMYAKFLSFESQCFGFNWCNFSNNQMNSKDINQILTKDGCARVQLYKILNIPFSYTMEVGYHGCPVKITQRNSYYDSGFKRSAKIFSIEDYMQHGKSIIISIFNMFLLNTSLGMKSKQGKHWQQLREQMFKDMIQKQERFRLSDGLVFKKHKIINDLMLQLIYHPVFKKYPTIQHDLSKYFIPQRKPIPHSLSYESSQQPKQILILTKKQFSLQMKNVSKTIQPQSNYHHHLVDNQRLKAFKSTIVPYDRPKLDDVDPFTICRGHKYAKMVNLDFNPFPVTDRKKLYSIMGLRKYSKKHQNSELYDVQSTYQQQNCLILEKNKAQVNQSKSQRSQSPDKLNQKIFQYGSTSSIRPIMCISPKALLPQPQLPFRQINFEQQQYLNYEQYQKKYEQRFLLPKINRFDRFKQPFNTQIQLLKQMDKKYNVKDTKEKAPYHNKVSLRNNGLKMKSLIRSIK